MPSRSHGESPFEGGGWVSRWYRLGYIPTAVKMRCSVSMRGGLSSREQWPILIRVHRSSPTRRESLKKIPVPSVRKEPP